MRISRLLFAAVGLLSAGVATAQEAATLNRNDRAVNLPSSGQANPAWNLGASAQDLQYQVIDSLANAFSYYTGQQQPLVWDPASNILATIHRGSPAVSGDGNNVYIRISRDLGATWSTRIGPLHTSAGQSGRYPSLAISNPTNSTNPADVLLFFTFPVLNGPSSGFGGFASGIVSAEGGEPLVSITNAGYEGGTFGSDSKPVIVNNGTQAVTVQNISGDAFAVRIFDFNAGAEVISIPAQFAGTNFRPGTTDGRYSATSGLDKDAAGTVYAGFLAYPSDFTDATRLRPAISMSSDNGETWSALAYAPENLINEYGQSLGYPADSTGISYDSDFIVTGPNQASFLVTVVAQDRSRTENVTTQQIVEIMYNNGAWSAQKIADVAPFIVALDGDGSGVYTESQMALEGQLERTADGTRLVAKYLEFFNYLPTGDFNGDGQTPDTVFTTDVLFVSRATAGGAWSAPVNVTESVTYDRTTWLPNLVPNDLKNIPLLTVQSALVGDETSDSARFIGMQRNLLARQYITVSQFDGSATSSVRGDVAVAARALNVYPNPANGQASASFTLPTAGQVSVRIHDVTGNEVFSLPTTQMTAGAHKVPFNTSSLANGVYYYTVSANGGVSTTMFTVVR